MTLARRYPTSRTASSQVSYTLNDDSMTVSQLVWLTWRGDERGIPPILVGGDMHVSGSLAPSIIEDFMTMARTPGGGIGVTLEDAASSPEGWSSPQTGECAYRPHRHN